MELVGGREGGREFKEQRRAEIAWGASERRGV